MPRNFQNLCHQLPPGITRMHKICFGPGLPGPRTPLVDLTTLPRPISRTRGHPFFISLSLNASVASLAPSPKLFFVPARLSPAGSFQRRCQSEFIGRIIVKRLVCSCVRQYEANINVFKCSVCMGDGKLHHASRRANHRENRQANCIDHSQLLFILSLFHSRLSFHLFHSIIFSRQYNTIFIQVLHTGFIGIWQPEAGLNKHIHIHKHEILDLQIKHRPTRLIEECYWRLVNA